MKKKIIAVAVAESNIQALLFGDYLWNKADNLPKNVSRVKNWQDVKEFFDAQG